MSFGYLHSQDQSGQPAWVNLDRTTTATQHNNPNLFFITPFLTLAVQEICTPLLRLRNVHGNALPIDDFHCAFKEFSLVRKLQAVTRMPTRVFGPQTQIVVTLG